MFDWTIGTFWLVFIGVGVVIAFRGYATQFFEKSDIKRVDKLFIAAIVVRLIWYFVYFVFIADSYPFMITDDFNYHYRADAASSILSVGRNNYQTFLNYLYYYFGSSSLNGRIVNLFASILCVYPIAYIERTINTHRTEFTATKMYIFFPFMVSICSFEIKDVLSMLFFATSCMIMLYMQKNNSMKRFVSFLLFCLLSELIRSGMGLLVLGVYSCSVIYKQLGGLSRNKGKKIFAFSCLTIFFLIAVTVLMSMEYYQDTMLLLGQYTAGRNKSIRSGSMFDFLTIDSVNELWKVPLDLVFYIMLPNSSEHVGRFMLDFGVYYRLFDMPISLLGVYWMIRKCKKFGFYSLCVIVPYVYLACFQIITFREVIFIVPLLYIFAVNYLYPEPTEGKHPMLKVRAGRFNENYRMALLVVLYLLWSCFILLRVR